jgi:hypothetical protein|tara:strand:- start:2469 stop:2834 length:366 start_codon:yes stop_codon:yes gene_type:complete
LSDATPASNSRKWLVTLSGGDDPAGTALRAGVDLALAAGAFGQSVTLVFCGKGLALLSNKPQTNGDLFRLLGSLPYYEIEQVHTLNLPPGSKPLREDLTILPMTGEEWSAAASDADIVVNY